MAVTYVTLYPPGGNSTTVQVVEGSQLHMIYADMGFSATPSAPGPRKRPDPFPQYVHDDEVGALVAGAAVAATDPVVAGLVSNSGSQTGVALRAAFASVADPLRPRPMPPRAQPHWLATFEAGHGITPTGTFTSFTDHTDDHLFGSQSVRLTIDPASSQAILPFTLPAPVDITDQHFVLWLKSADIDRIGPFELRLGDGINFFRIANWTLGAEKPTHNDRWTPVAFSMARKASDVGTPSLTDITAGELRVSSTAAGGLDLLIDSLGMVPYARAAFPRGAVTFVFDDAFDDIDTEAARIMDRYGYPGVTAAIANATEVPGKASLARLRALQDLHGWEIGGHAPSSDEEAARLTSMTWEQRESYLIRLKTWMRNEGFYSDFFVYPGGEQDTEIIEQVGRYFNTARDTSGQPRFNLPNYLDPLMLTQSGAGAGMLAAIAETAAHSHWTVLYFHKVGTGGISITDFEAVVEACNTAGVEVLTVEQVLNRQRAVPPFAAVEAPVDALVRTSTVTLPLAAATALSHTNFNSVAFSSSHFFGSYRAGGGVLNDEVVFLLPSPLLAGTYAGTFVHSTNTSFGIITLSTSADGASWTDHTTVDTYAATAANVVIAALPPLTIADGAQYVRLKVTGRNAANTTAYNARVSSLSLTRTGA